MTILVSITGRACNVREDYRGYTVNVVSYLSQCTYSAVNVFRYI